MSDISGTNNSERLIGTAASESIYTGNGADTVLAGAGNDSVNGAMANGQASYYQVTGAKLMSGEEGNDFLYGGSDADTIAGDAGNDTLYGDAGNDSLSGGSGDDQIKGGDGNDAIDAGEGADSIDTGNGVDSVLAGSGNDNINGYTVDSQAGTYSFNAYAGSKSVDAGAGDDFVFGGTGNDSFTIGSEMIRALESSYGGGGNLDRLARVDGGAGVDTLRLTGGDLMLNLTQIANQGASFGEVGSRLSSIERMDLTGSGNNTLKLSVGDVLDLSGVNDLFGLFGSATFAGRHELAVRGNAGDEVALTDKANWVFIGNYYLESMGYAVYNHNSSAATLFVDMAVAVL